MVMDKIALTLLIIGGAELGQRGTVPVRPGGLRRGGAGSLVSRVVYALVGLSAVWCVSLLFRDRDPVESGADPCAVRDNR